MANPEEKSINLVVLTPEREAGRKLAEDACAGHEKGDRLARFGSFIVQFTLLEGAPESGGIWDKEIQSADAFVLVLRHIDMVSMEKVKTLYHLLPSDNVRPCTVLISRMAGEVDFKMSCPFCGQKLWVRDSDVDKRGRCPNCTKAFTLPYQTRHLRSQLKCPDSLPIAHVYQGNATANREAIRNLLGKIHGEILEVTASPDPEVMKKSTVRVQVQDSKNESA